MPPNTVTSLSSLFKEVYSEDFVKVYFEEVKMAKDLGYTSWFDYIKSTSEDREYRKHSKQFSKKFSDILGD